MCEFIKFIEKHNTNSDKHYLDDELVQISFENLIKKSKVNTKPDTLNAEKIIYWIKVNSKIYNINKQKTDELEPKTILLKINEVEFKTKFDDKTDTLIYLDKLDYFDLIFDYLQGYSVENIQYIFNGKENEFYCNDNINVECKQISNLEKFIILVHRLKMYNLLEQIYKIFSYIRIDDFTFICNKNTINKIEPNNTLLSLSKKYYLKNHFYHNRDINIFKKYFMKYILGLQDLQTTVTNLLKLRDGRDTPEHQNKQEKQYEFYKVLNDIEYYGFKNLFNKIR